MKLSKMLTIVVALITIVASVVSASATNISYWYGFELIGGSWSATNSFFYIPNSGTVYYYLDNTVANTTHKSYMNTAVTYALSEWGTDLGITFTRTYNVNDADLKLNMCDYSDYSTVFIDAGITESAYGYTPYAEFFTLKETVYWGSTPKYVYEQGADEYRNVYVWYKSTTTQNGYKYLVTHEIGHALGYDGHYQLQDVLMYGGGGIRSILTPQYTDLNHVKQIYDLY